MFPCSLKPLGDPRILIQGDPSSNFYCGHSNFMEYLQRYQILLFIYYKFCFSFIVIQYTVYVVGTLAAI